VLKRHQWLDYLERETDTDVEIGMEACGGAHQWARQLSSRGFCVKLIAPQFVKPYVKSNKTDHADAEAIAEALSRPEMRFVDVKSVGQQDMQAIYRIREELIKRRTALANQIRGLVAEYGLVALGLDAAAYGTHSLRRTKPTLIYKRTHNLRAVQLLLGHTP